MSLPKKKPSFSLADDLIEILDISADRMGISRSEVVANLVLYHGLCGGDFPLTSKILALPSVDRQRLLGDVLERFKSDDPPKPQEFRKWVKEVLGKADQETIEKGADALIRALLHSDHRK